MPKHDAPAHIGLTSARLAPTICGTKDPDAVRLALQDLTPENLQARRHNRWTICEGCAAGALGRPATIAAAEQLPIPLTTWEPMAQTTVLALLGWTHRPPQRGDGDRAFHQRRTVLDAATVVVGIFNAGELWEYLQDNGWIERRRA